MKVIPELEAQMRARECFHDLRVPLDNWIVVRVDGRGFTKLANDHFDRPFDERFSKGMEHVAQALLDDTHGLYAYTQSDEVSVLLPPNYHQWGRKVEKIVSTMAGLASAAWMAYQTFPGTKALAHEPLSAFDARIWVGATTGLVANYFVWRHQDAYRNAVNGYAYWYLRQKEKLSARAATARLEGKTTSDKLDLLYAHYINMPDKPAWARYGIGLYYEPYMKQATDLKTGEAVSATRYRLKVDRELPELSANYADYVRARCVAPWLPSEVSDG